MSTSEATTKLSYRDALRAAMASLADDERTIFMGQAVAFPGTAMTATLADVPREKLLELPVAEDMQLGMATGMAIAGHLPVCIFPRWNFLLLAMSQLVLHLDKLPRYSGFRPHVIIRTAVATDEPLDPGPQHLGDFTDMVKPMLHTVAVYRLRDAAEVEHYYRRAHLERRPCILVEYADCYA